jgi:serine/threonine protein kinase
MAIDMWSLGCILCELYTGYPLLPGEDESDQFACIVELLGMPPKSMINAGKRCKHFISSKGYPRYCEAITMADGSLTLTGGTSRRGKRRGPPGTRQLKSTLKNCDDAYFIDFIRGCLEWNSEERLKPDEALRHPWMRRRLPRPPRLERPSSHTTRSIGNCSNYAVESQPSSSHSHGASYRCCKLPQISSIMWSCTGTSVLIQSYCNCTTQSVKGVYLRKFFLRANFSLLFFNFSIIILYNSSVPLPRCQKTLLFFFNSQIRLTILTVIFYYIICNMIISERVC